MFEILDTDDQGNVHLEDIVVDAKPCAQCGSTDALYVTEYGRIVICSECGAPVTFTD